jgi:hypothetical protein
MSWNKEEQKLGINDNIENIHLIQEWIQFFVSLGGPSKYTFNSRVDKSFCKTRSPLKIYI